jgi:hypothetical protein
MEGMPPKLKNKLKTDGSKNQSFFGSRLPSYG